MMMHLNLCDATFSQYGFLSASIGVSSADINDLGASRAELCVITVSCIMLFSCTMYVAKYGADINFHCARIVFLDADRVLHSANIISIIILCILCL